MPVKKCPKGHTYDSSLGPCPFCLPTPKPVPPPPPPPPPPQPLQRVRPVVGWLVCAQGNDIGKDFRLHVNFNHVGQNANMDIRLTDPYVSHDKHFTVSYALQSNLYFAEMGQGKSFVHINGQPLVGSTQLKKGDQIQVGNTLLIFIPLEQKCVKWNWKP